MKGDSSSQKGWEHNRELLLCRLYLLLPDLGLQQNKERQQMGRSRVENSSVGLNISARWSFVQTGIFTRRRILFLERKRLNEGQK